MNTIRSKTSNNFLSAKEKRRNKYRFLLVCQGQLSISAVEHVIETFLSNVNTKDYEGMKFVELYEQCKRSFYVNNEQNLRLQLIEFIDHRLIKLCKSTQDGLEIVKLLLAEQDIMKQLLDKLN